MSNCEIVELSVESKEWKDIYDKHGEGKIQPRYDFTTECTEEAFPNHTVVRGRRSDNSLTGTGFLRNQTGQIIAGVDQLP